MSSSGGGRGGGRDMVSVIASPFHGFRKPSERLISDRLPVAVRSPEGANGRRERGVLSLTSTAEIRTWEDCLLNVSDIGIVQTLIDIAPSRQRRSVTPLLLNCESSVDFRLHIHIDDVNDELLIFAQRLSQHSLQSLPVADIQIANIADKRFHMFECTGFKARRAIRIELRYVFQFSRVRDISRHDSIMTWMCHL
ncbi:MAG: hypothetical protein JWM11_2978 [Planctomycetaceae bacterium]|nr:hypothetical protein [Planctomycetaceae bacterium]